MLKILNKCEWNTNYLNSIIVKILNFNIVKVYFKVSYNSNDLVSLINTQNPK